MAFARCSASEDHIVCAAIHLLRHFHFPGIAQVSEQVFVNQECLHVR